ncbi:hypothetical protein BJY04DRAFT_213652 [Aspergillus karnatakaensis]|uniref:uncharacterized protein n=1 Tax=Aspergillus karnatakaensis TaxID=1810916 RepID=UPI003CCDF401
MRTPEDAEKASIARGLLLDQTEKHANYPSYFTFYQSIFCPEEEHGTIIQIDNPVLSSHGDILRCASHIRANAQQTQEVLGRTLFPGNTVSHRDRHDAIHSTIRVMFMLDCFLKDKFSPNYEVSDYSPARWEAHEPLVTYVERAIPKDPMQRISDFQPHKAMYKEALKAWELKKRCHLQFLPTNNIMEHLLYDPRTRTVQIFHHTAYLSAHLRHAKGQPLDQSASESLKMGMLPPQLLLETLHTIHSILFPIMNDKTGKSSELLKDLIAKHGFDPNAIWDTGLISDGFRYQYWNQRLEILYRLVINPPPRNRLARWVERHTSERNALTVALIALFLNAFFGMMACLIGGAQLAIAILAWKDQEK